MNIVLFDTDRREFLYPFTLSRPVAAARCGILTAAEYWQLVFEKQVHYLCPAYLAGKYSSADSNDHLYINAAWLPLTEARSLVPLLQAGESIWYQNQLIAGRISGKTIRDHTELNQTLFHSCKNLESAEKFLLYPWDILVNNAAMINLHYSLLTAGRNSAAVSGSNQLIHPENIFFEEGVEAVHCIINASAGPVYIGKNSVIMEGSMIRGPFAMGEGSVLKMGTKIYGATSLGPGCMAGGEIKNSVFFGYSNKAHDGYIGDSVLGEFCNLGAGSSCSNVKNTGGTIKLWLNAENKFVDAGNKIGVFMGDHTRCAINTSVNSGTVMGVCNNVFGTGLTPKVIGSFSWGTDGKTAYEFNKAMEDCNNWMQFKNQQLTEADRQILKHIYNNR